LQARVAARDRASAKHTVTEPKPNLKMPFRLASLEGAAPPVQAIPSRIPSNVSSLTGLGRQKPARTVAREWSSSQTSAAEYDHALAKHAAIEVPKPHLKPPVRLASLEGAAPRVRAKPSRIPSKRALTSLVDFETAPFPYHGTMPGSDRPFLNAGTEGHPGHVRRCSLGISNF
jgi:hypothetical protein